MISNIVNSNNIKNYFLRRKRVKGVRLKQTICS